MNNKEKKLFTKKELRAFGEFCRDEGKTQTLEKVKDWIKELERKEAKKTGIDVSDVLIDGEELLSSLDDLKNNSQEKLKITSGSRDISCMSDTRKGFNNLLENPVGASYGAEPIFKEPPLCKRDEIRYRGDRKVNGNFAGSFNYSVLHKYMRRRIKKPEICEICKKKGFLELAFKNHKARFDTPKLYTRNVDDWYYICRSCHMKEDGRCNQVKSKVCKCGKKIIHNQYGDFHYGGGKDCGCKKYVPKEKE